MINMMRYQKIAKLQELIREQYNYGFNRQMGNLAYRSSGYAIQTKFQDELKPTKIKRRYPLHRKNKARRAEHFSDLLPSSYGHPLVREAFVKGSADGDKEKYRSEIILKIQAQVV